MLEQPPDLELARRLIAGQFPAWASLQVREVEHSGWDNRTYRLGELMLVRLPRSGLYREQVVKEQRWLPVLAPQLPLQIPRPIATGAPGLGYPYAWSVYEWIEGAHATPERIDDPVAFARAAALFLVALRGCDPADGPPPGQHNWWRGAPLTGYLDEARRALRALAGEVDAPAATAILDEAVASTWPHPPVWIHGDVAPGNLLVRDGRLVAVIDFGCSGVGDPACDVVLAWTLLAGPARAAFAEALGLDHATWARGRGWALWKALITAAGSRDDRQSAAEARRLIAEILADPVG